MIFKNLLWEEASAALAMLRRTLQERPSIAIINRSQSPHSVCIRCQVRLQYTATQSSSETYPLRRNEGHRGDDGYRGGRQTSRHPPRQPRTYIDRQSEHDSTSQLEFMKAKRPRPQAVKKDPILTERKKIDSLLRGRKEDIQTVAQVGGQFQYNLT